MAKNSKAQSKRAPKRRAPQSAARAENKPSPVPAQPKPEPLTAPLTLAEAGKLLGCRATSVINLADSALEQIELMAELGAHAADASIDKETLAQALHRIWQIADGAQQTIARFQLAQRRYFNLDAPAGQVQS